MIVIMNPHVAKDSDTWRDTLAYLEQLPNIAVRQHEIEGTEQTLHEIYLIGDTKRLDSSDIEHLDGVERVVRISEEYRILGRHADEHRAHGFTYNGVRFDQDSFHVFAGLCAVDTLEHVDQMMAAVASEGAVCTRMGAYKPRTNPYSFQGHGKDCLPWVFESAGKHGIRVIAMEVTHEIQLQEITEALHAAGDPTGVMLQIGTRNTQNFELLKAVGRQQRYPVLLKRGFGVSLNESLNAAEYLASEGNADVVFCLRGMKGEAASPHRNAVDFGHVPVVKRLTRMPVCIDPSHSVGTRDRSPDGILEVVHAAAEGVVAGANMILVDFHPEPATALVDGPQALLLSELSRFMNDMEAVHTLYQRRRELWSTTGVQGRR